METVVRQVRDLDQIDRTAIERVVGHELLEGQKLVIQVMSDPAVPAEALEPTATDEEAAARLLDRTLPSNEELRSFAIRHRPPDEWFAHDEERPFWPVRGARLVPKPEHGRIVWTMMRSSDGSTRKKRTAVILTRTTPIVCRGEPR
jgi:hypothetical protein